MTLSDADAVISLTLADLMSHKSTDTNAVVDVTQERRLQAERTGRMIDLTMDVSPTVVAQTAAKLEAEQQERDAADFQKELEETLKPYEQRVVSISSTVASSSNAYHS